MVQAVHLRAQRGSAFGVVKPVKHLHCVSKEEHCVSKDRHCVRNEEHCVRKDEPRALSSRYIFSIYLQITTRGSTTSGCFRA